MLDEQIVGVGVEQRKRMHLAVEAVGAKHSGAATVLLDFLDALVSSDSIERVTVFASPKSVRRFDFSGNAKLYILDQPSAERRPIGRIAWYECGLARACGEQKADALLCINGMGLGHGVPQINLIQQSLPFYKEALNTLSLKQKINMGVIERVTRRSTRMADCVLVQTPTMASWVREQFGLGHKRIESFIPTVTLPMPNPSSSALDPLRAVPSERRILYVGNQAVYKKVDALLEGILLVRQHLPEATLFLTWPLDHPVSRIPGVQCLGFLSRDVLAEAYRLSTALVLGSLVETVGLPMMEAMSVGTPVLAADRPYAHDICGEAALYFEPTIPGAFAQISKTLLINPELRAIYSARGRKRMEHHQDSRPYKQMASVTIETIASRKR